MNRLNSLLIFGGAILMGSSDIMSQNFGVEYTTELQTDFCGKYDWLNLLNTSLELPLSHEFAFEASTISTSKTADAPLVDDLLTYSNIEAGNIPLTLSRLGFGFSKGGIQLFVGINNVNEDYFTSEKTSFFTNSSCGISPTISCNFDIANYPLAAWCIHYRQQIGDWSVQSSLYPGKGYKRFLGHDNLFTMNLKRDGIFSISSIDYRRNDLYCVLGVALHYGVCMGDVDGEQAVASTSPTTTPEKRFSASPWLLSEYSLSCGLGLHAHTSFSTVRQGCKAYGGLGVIYHGKRVEPGVALNYASFGESSEGSVELTCRIPLLSDKACLQPALHLVSPDLRSVHPVGLFRLAVQF